MSLEENKALVRRFFEAIDGGDAAILDQFLSPDYDDHDPPPFPGLAPGLEGARQAFQYALTAFSDFRHTIEDQIAEGDKVATAVKAYGKHTGEFLGIAPTGKEVSMRGIAIHRVANGRLAEHWGRVDNVGLLMQLGAIRAPA